MVCLVDAYDVLALPAAGELTERFERAGKPLLFAAERSLWPDEALQALYPDAPAEAAPAEAASAASGAPAAASRTAASISPVRFLNSGTVVGRAWALRFMLRTVRSYGALSLCGPDDQRAFHRFFLAHRRLVALDYGQRAFQTLHFLREPLRVDGRGQVWMGAVGSSSAPCLVHGNGGDGKRAFARVVKGWAEALRTGKPTLVQPPPFALGILRFREGDAEGAAAAFRDGAASEEEPLLRLDCAYNLGVALTELGR